MKILTQNLKNGKTDFLEVPSPAKKTNKIRVVNNCSLISTGTESIIVNFGKSGWLNKALQQPDRVKDVINKIKSSGISDTYKAIKNKLDLPMPMGYAAVGEISEENTKHGFSKGDRVFTNSFHQEEALIDHNMCVPIPDNVNDRSASFGAIGGIAMQSIKCIPNGSANIAIIGLGLLGQVTFRILNALGYNCIVHDIDDQKVQLAVDHGAIGVQEKDISEFILNNTHGIGVDCTIIAASSTSHEIINKATEYTRRKGKIISSGLVGLNLIREKFFKKQIELVVSNSSGNKTHKNEGSSYENISYFFQLISSRKIKVEDLISDEKSINHASQIYAFPKKSLFFSRLIRYDKDNIKHFQTISKSKKIDKSDKTIAGLIGAGNYAQSTLIPIIKKCKNVHLEKLYAREGLSILLAKERFNINSVTTSDNDFYKEIDSVFITTPHESHHSLIIKSIDFSKSTWVEKPLVITIKELIDIRGKMLSKSLVYAVGYNRSLAPWTSYIKKKINFQKTKIIMKINAGKLPLDHWLLNKEKCGGRILGELCHFIDLSLTLLNHTKLISVKCVRRDKHLQDTGKFIMFFDDGSSSEIDYRYDLPPNQPKERINVYVSEKKYYNNNWKKFSSNESFNFSFITKGKGQQEAVNSFIDNVKNKNFSSKNEINDICFSTYTSIKLQEMNEGDHIEIQEEFKKEISGP